MMLENNAVIVSILITLNVVIGVLGYVVGRINCNQGVSTNVNRKNVVKTSESESVKIDDTKVVTTIRTDNLQKKFDSLGDKKESQENISSAINKLKGMKG